MGWELHRRCQHQISQCEQELAAALEQLPDRGNPPERPLPAKPKGKKINAGLRQSLYCKLGVDQAAFPTEKHFCS